MKITEIAFTGYPVTDMKRARAFYEEVLGLTPSHVFSDANFAWVEYDIGPGTISISNGAPDWKPNPGGGVAGFEVEDFATAIAGLKAAGTKFLVEPMESPVCHMAVISDPDGNSICIHKRKAS
jgi:predicted enzyme related to lactoylglutathione lyase